MRRENRKRWAGESHVRLYRHELDCPAYRTLRPAARALLIEMRALFDPRRGDNLVFLSLREMMARCNISQLAATKARDELIDKGWITVVEPGGFTRKTRHATVYALQNDPPNSGNGSKATKAYMRWQPPERKNTVLESNTQRYSNRIPRRGKWPLTVSESNTVNADFDPSTVLESNTQISITKRRAA